MLVKCNICKGQKKIVGLGYIDRDCPTCDGTGAVTFKEALEPAIEKLHDQNEELSKDLDESNNPLPYLSERKKPGRKPREIKNEL